jgi:uncharacterized protein with NRDE domain
MCLLFVAIDAHPVYSLVLAANRDEFYDRPSVAVQFWEDAPGVLAGRDLRGGGTWLGVNREGLWAAVTNFREPSPVAAGGSRGHLVRDYLLGTSAVQRSAPGHTASYAERYAQWALANGSRFAGFNLLLGDTHAAVHCSNRSTTASRLDQGIYGLSNHLLDTPWPKLTEGKRRFAEALDSGETLDLESVFGILADREEAAAGELPDTGVGREWERRLSPAFIAMEGYGTRCSTVLSIDRAGRMELTERRFLTDESGHLDPGRYESSSYGLVLPGRA